MDDSTPRRARFRAMDRTRAVRSTWEELLPADDPIRTIDEFVRSLDCSALDDRIRSVEGRPGAPAFDPRLLLGLCSHGLLEGIDSFRGLASACGRDLPLLWLCGGLRPNDHTASSFSADRRDFLDGQLAAVLAALRPQGRVDYKEVTLDGRKVPANAGKESMHRAKTLAEHEAEAAERVAELRAERDAKGGEASVRGAARRRGAEDRLGRRQAARETLAKRTRERVETKGGDPAEARASETDPDARTMQVSDGGYRPAFDVPAVTGTTAGLIAAVRVTAGASDDGLLEPMVRQSRAATGVRPTAVLADAGSSSCRDVEVLEKARVKVFVPPKNARREREDGRDPCAAKRRDSEAVRRWRKRQGTAAGRARYRRRAPVAEGTHARQSNRGFERFRGRGLGSATTEVLWQALAHDLGIAMRNAWTVGGKLRPEAG